MDKLIADFPNQLLEAIKIAKNTSLGSTTTTIQQVVISGLGGSGIGGNLTKQFSVKEASVPIIVNKKYHLPNFVNESTLVIISSYSGNTEETLAALKLAHQKKAIIVAITSGGAIADYCRKNNLDLVLLPDNSPSPRACLGYSFVQQLYLLKHFGIINQDLDNDITSASNLIVEYRSQIHEKAKEVAKLIAHKTPILYAADDIEAVAIRWRQQFNENGKQLCWHHVVPEMNHNELVGWKEKNENLVVVWLRNETDFERTQIRMDINKKIINQYTPHQIECWSKGVSDIQRAVYLIHLGDWISFYLSELRGFDAIEIEVIDYLKEELAKV